MKGFFILYMLYKYKKYNMSFSDVDAFINKIVLEHKFDYLCSNNFEEFVYEEPVIDTPKDCFKPNIEYNEIYQNSQDKFGELEKQLLSIEKKLRTVNIIECPICMNYCSEYVKPQCGHTTCVNCFIKNSKTSNGHKCCLCRKQLYVI